MILFTVFIKHLIKTYFNSEVCKVSYINPFTAVPLHIYN